MRWPGHICGVIFCHIRTFLVFCPLDINTPENEAPNRILVGLHSAIVDSGVFVSFVLINPSAAPTASASYR
jgi:hypothetical protein